MSTEDEQAPEASAKYSLPIPRLTASNSQQFTAENPTQQMPVEGTYRKAKYQVINPQTTPLLLPQNRRLTDEEIGDISALVKDQFGWKDKP
ncbi:hypothetical protein SERLADRAFT_432081 [Serpula lacrymans var. lacrymans S7.9]|uniref:Uncharacterized protein n=1 Tax=Serpula lacrymans var. lacrymans (strain S7.9) TaxID=578457 RepID=F8NDY2_SERL9|nr:uncharacterized protein SERLADRAFT_432081 [Serpula lacrymans var. lacrymans S7.9]EGO30510.1 hypothetical protein SERLADRAFT_432081 [Serpula lacrymans var. lacrymans S7.9]